MRPIENWAAAEQAARHALALDPSIASAHAVLANVNAQRGNWMEAETHSAASLSLGGNDGDIHFYRGLFLGRVGKRADALAETRKAMELAPANPFVIAKLAGRYSDNGRDAEALKYAGLAIDLGYPRDTTPLPGVRRNAALRAKRYAEAAEIEAKRYEVSDPERARAIKLVYAAVADPRQRARALAALGRLYPARAPRSPADLADIGPCLEMAYRYVLLSALDEAYALANQCLDRMTPGAGGRTGSRPVGILDAPLSPGPALSGLRDAIGAHGILAAIRAAGRLRSQRRQADVPLKSSTRRVGFSEFSLARRETTSLRIRFHELNECLISAHLTVNGARDRGRFWILIG